MRPRFAIVLVPALVTLAASSISSPPRAHATSVSTAPTTSHVRERKAAALKAYGIAAAQLEAGRSSAEIVYTWSRRWAEAEVDDGGKGAWSDHLDRIKRLQASVDTMVKAGLATTLEGTAADFYVAEAKQLAGVP